VEEEDKDEKLGQSETERDNALAEIIFIFGKVLFFKFFNILQ